MSKRFFLSKWYMDCTTHDGESIIAYTARVTWRGLVVHYNAWLHVQKNGKVVTHSAMTRTTEPKLQDNTLNWQWKNFNGTWKNQQPEIREELLKNENGIIDWHCMFPHSTAEIKIGDRVIHGMGYCEKMEMSIAPWKLPIDELFWGRFTSEGNYITWIEWKGSVPLKRAYYNGKCFTEFEITESGIRFAETSLKFENPTEIRKGNLASTVFKSFAWVKRLFPVKSLYMREYKYAAQGVLTHGNASPVMGRVIYERVVL